MDPDQMPGDTDADDLRAEVDRLRDLCAQAEAAVGIAEAEADDLRARLAQVTAERDEAIHERNLAAGSTAVPTAPSPAGMAGRLRSKFGR